jgi:hypothetical protein
VHVPPLLLLLLITVAGVYKTRDLNSRYILEQNFVSSFFKMLACILFGTTESRLMSVAILKCLVDQF